MCWQRIARMPYLSETAPQSELNHHKSIQRYKTLWSDMNCHSNLYHITSETFEPHNLFNDEGRPCVVRRGCAVLFRNTCGGGKCSASKRSFKIQSACLCHDGTDFSRGSGSCLRKQLQLIYAVQGGLHFRRRNLLQFQPSQCLWNTLSSECEIGDSALESLLGRGKSAYAKFYSRQYVQHSHLIVAYHSRFDRFTVEMRNWRTDEESLRCHERLCLATVQTDTSSDRKSKASESRDGWCTFVDYVGVYPESPCVKNGTRSRLFEALQWQCPSRTSRRACSKLFGCTW